VCIVQIRKMCKYQTKKIRMTKWRNEIFEKCTYVLVVVEQ